MTMVEKDQVLVQRLKQQVQILETKDVEINYTDALQWLQSQTRQYDIIFLDPPFGQDLLAKTCELLINKGHLRPKALVYIEVEPGFEINNNYLQVVKQSQAGQVQYMLLESA